MGVLYPQEAIIRADGKVLPVPADLYDRQGLLVRGQLIELIGGPLELAPSKFPGWVLIVNHNGLLEDLPVNKTATKLIGEKMCVLDALRGDAVLMARGRVGI